MNTTLAWRLAAIVTAAVLTACGESTRLPSNADVGQTPTLVAPVKTLLPTVNIAPAAPWPAGQTPLAAPGLRVAALASGLEHPRWLHVLPNGDVLVAESNAPPRPEDGKGIKGWIMKLVMKRAGAGVPSANRITLLRDADGDGVAEVKTSFLQNLNSPFGMALVGDRFYVANTDAVMEFAYVTGETNIQATGRKLTDLPGGALNHHWTKALIASPDGSKLYATVGSNSNVAENGIAAEEGRAAIWEIDRLSGSKRLFATGLRNPNGMAWIGVESALAGAPAASAAPAAPAPAPAPAPSASTSALAPTAPTLWTVVNERDEIGSDLVPDYLTSVRDGAFYGWPYSWYGKQVDSRVDPPRPDLVARPPGRRRACSSGCMARGTANHIQATRSSSYPSPTARPSLACRWMC